MIRKLKLPAVIIIGACALTVITHWPALSAKALLMDDEQYVTDNALVLNPSWNSVHHFFSEILKPSTVGGYYQPLTMTSLMLDSAMASGADLFAYHRTSLALHTANVSLTIVLIYMLFDNIWIAAAVGLLFGLHPMTVETIPWLGERKTLLAAFFSLCSLIFYVRFVREKDKKSNLSPDTSKGAPILEVRFYVASFLMYLLALLSKPTSLPLPIVMLLMDFWPLKRKGQKHIIEKLPLFVLAAVFAVIFYISQSRTAGISLPGQYEHHLLNVPLIICHNIVFYLSKMLWPVSLSSHYPYPEPFDLSNPRLLITVVAAIIIVFLLAISVRWTLAPLIGWLIFFIMILPTMQVIRFSDVVASDKFVYLPAIGLLMVLAAFLKWIYGKRRGLAFEIGISVVLLAGLEAVAARRYLACWQDSIILYKHMLSVDPKSSAIYDNLGMAYAQLGRYDDALEALQKAIALNPDSGSVYYDLGVFYLDSSQPDKAVDAFAAAVRLVPDYSDAYLNLSIAYWRMGRFEESLKAAHQAAKLQPNSAAVYLNLGFVCGNLGKYPEAVNAYGQAVRIDPKDPKARFGLALASLQAGEPNVALQQYEILKSLDPNSADRLGNFLKK